MADKRRGLGRGIGALIPTGQEEKRARPIDVFFSSANSENDSTQVTNDGAEGSVSERAVPDPTSMADTQSQEPVVETKGKPKAEVKPQQTRKSKPAADRVRESGSSNSHDDKVGKKGDAPVKDSEGANTAASDEETLLPVPGATFGEIDVEAIVPNQKQPRQIFDEDDLNELAESVREVGVLQPIVVRPLAAPLAEQPMARYELIMGERRWRASQLAGNSTVPAIVRRTEDSDLLRDALLENLHRAQLNPLEEAAAYQQLLDDFNCTQEELSRRIARSRPQISNTLRLLKLPPLVQRRVAAGILSAGHARALLGLTDPASMERLAQRIVAEGLSVRATEEIVALGDDQAPTSRRRGRVSQYEDELNDVASRLADRFETKVVVNMGQRKGRIAIDFGSIDDLNRILHHLNESGVDLPGQDHGVQR